MADPDVLKICLSPTYIRSVEYGHFAAMMRLVMAPIPTARVRFAPGHNDALLCRARSKLATQFLASDDDVMVMIDGDIAFEPRAFHELARQAVTHDIVAALYTTRSGGERCRPTSIFNVNETVEFSNDPTPRPIRWAATGFFAVHRRVLEKLAPTLEMHHPGEATRFRPFFQPFSIEGPGGPIYLSEDYAFCERARRAGFTVHVNPAIRIQHLGLYPFTVNDLGRTLPEDTPLRATYQPDGRYRIDRPAPRTA
jgi:Glycosyltransferase like family 2